MKVCIATVDHDVTRFTLDASGTVDTELAAVTIPEVNVDHDMNIVLDARGAGPVNVSTPKPTEPLLALHQIRDTLPGGGTR